MSLDQFESEFHLDRPCLNAVICLYHNQNTYAKSRINEMLGHLQEDLKRERSRYETVDVAYVYETASLNARPFCELTEDAPVYYKESCQTSTVHDLAGVVFMGLAMLEQKIRQDGPSDRENRLYLLTDEPFNRVQVNRIIQKNGADLTLHPRFRTLAFVPFLIRTEKAGGDILEAYIRAHGDVKIV